LRQGEQRALTWADLDLDNSKVDVNKAVKHRADVGPPKSPKGYRKVTLPRGLAIQLRELYIKRGRPAKTELVFPTRTGAIISDSRFQENMDKACAQAGVEKIRWHDLRHYYASQLLRAFKNDWWTITNLMGHESVQTTQETYGHWIEDEEKDAHMLDAVSSIFE
ncbi:MAG: site-specific integrase, partial [Pseudomonadota bacterium]|nr:site-specific integrase [Pseudomonadota bacterium]